MTLPQEQVDEVRRLLATGQYSQRRIARMSGVSRGTVLAIATDRRPDYLDVPPSEKPPDLYRRVTDRCPGCGALALLHCLTGHCRACQLRQHLQIGQVTGRSSRLSDDLSEGPLGLELAEGDRQRYEQIRRRPHGPED